MMTSNYEYEGIFPREGPGAEGIQRIAEILNQKAADGWEPVMSACGGIILQRRVPEVEADAQDPPWLSGKAALTRLEQEVAEAGHEVITSGQGGSASAWSRLRHTLDRWAEAARAEHEIPAHEILSASTVGMAWNLLHQRWSRRLFELSE